jgi:acyl-CoA synthetase (AMP-forming)/AMP-acid ligase II
MTVRPTIVDVLRRRSGEHASRRLFAFLDEHGVERAARTYGELDENAARIARTLRRHAQPGDRAMLLVPAGIRFFDAFFACLYARIIAVPAYPPSLTNRSGIVDRLRATARDCGPRVVMTTGEQMRLKPRWLAQLPELRYAEWIAVEEAAADGEEWRDDPPRSDDLAFLQYTSGSVATPKGVAITHDNIAANEEAIEALVGQDAMSASAVSWLPPQHDMGLIGTILHPLYRGSWCSYITPLSFLSDPMLWLRIISRQRATTTAAPDFAYRLCVERSAPDQRRELDLSRLQVALCGAERVRRDTLELFSEAFACSRLRKGALLPVYGLAESTLLVSGTRSGAAVETRWLNRRALEHGKAIEVPPGAEQAYDVVSCGQPAAGQQIAIVDPSTRRRCKDGAVGEIWVRGPSVALGYWCKPDETASTFAARIEGESEETYLRTGDLGFTSCGELYVTGRLKEVIVIHGRKVYPEDVEATARGAHDGARLGRGAAFGWPLESAEAIVVVHEVDTTRRYDFDDAAKRMVSAVASAHDTAVKAVVVVPLHTLPRTPSGKIKRSAAQAQLEAGRLPVVAHWPDAVTFGPPSAEDKCL